MIIIWSHFYHLDYGVHWFENLNVNLLIHRVTNTTQETLTDTTLWIRSNISSQ